MSVRVPSSLGKAGRALWRSIAGNYQLRADELVILENACAVADMIAALTKSWVDDGSPMTSAGSMGQEVIHPLIGEIRQQQGAQARLLGQLKLPDVALDIKPNQHRSAAKSRWASAHGRTA